MDQNFFQQAQSLIPAEVRMISGCEDYQTSADVSNVSKFELPDPAGRAGGACTSALLDILYADTSSSLSNNSSKRFFRRSRNSNSTQLTFQDVLMKLRSKLEIDGFSQIPQLTSSRPLDIQGTPFHLVGGDGTGKRRAVLVGINYIGQNGQLSGCHNDAINMKQYIQKVHGFKEEDIVMLLDDGSNQRYPTRSILIQALKSLVAKSVAGDSVFFHYSGHGGLLEADGNAFKNKNSEYDQTLIPLDYESAGQIRDFSLFTNFVQPMAAGVTVTCIMDCCHSGSVLDLPYSFRATNEGEAPRMIENVAYLSNLAFLYTLAGNVLPAGFEHISHYIGDIIGGNLEDYHGLGFVNEEALADFDTIPDTDELFNTDFDPGTIEEYAPAAPPEEEEEIPEVNGRELDSFGFDQNQSGGEQEIPDDFGNNDDDPPIVNEDCCDGCDLLGFLQSMVEDSDADGFGFDYGEEED